MNFKKICNEFEEYYSKCSESEQKDCVTCAKNYIAKKYNKKSDLLLLKVVALDNDYAYYSAMMLSLYSVFIAIVSLLKSNWIIAVISVALIILLFRPQMVFYLRFKNIHKWRNCILVATEELIAECNDKKN